MPNAFGTNIERSSWYVIGIFVALAIAVVIVYTFWLPASGAVGCPTTLHRSTDGSVRLEPSGQVFPDMNAFQKWWHVNREVRHGPLPILTGSRRPLLEHEQEGSNEQTYATTPIYKVDDYEFSRVFGNERNGHMDVPVQNFNVILNQRNFDWADKPLSSDERRSKYMGLHEGFTATGDLKSIVLAEPSAVSLVLASEEGDSVRDAVQQYSRRPQPPGPHHPRPHHPGPHHPDDEDISCHLSRESKEVAALVAKAYESDPNYEPVVTKVGANHWEVNELKPLRRPSDDRYSDPRNNKVVDTSNDAVDIAFEYRERQTVDQAIDPYFTTTGDLPYESARNTRDPWYGPVPGMERMFGPTFDHKSWY